MWPYKPVLKGLLCLYGEGVIIFTSLVLVMEVGASLGLEVLKDLTKEGIRKVIEEQIEKHVLERKTMESVIYFTMFNPRVSSIDVNEFLENIANSAGQKVPVEVFSQNIYLQVGKSKFVIDAYTTKLGDILFYDAMYQKLLDALEGGEAQYEVNAIENKELAHEFGIDDSRYLEKISDITVIILPFGRPRAEDVYKLIQVIYDKGGQDLGTDRAIAKITIYAPPGSRELNDIEKKLRDLRVRVYRLSNKIEKLVVVLSTPSQILNGKVYKAIYGGGLPFSLLH
jgi:hypothetical protein